MTAILLLILVHKADVSMQYNVTNVYQFERKLTP